MKQLKFAFFSLLLVVLGGCDLSVISRSDDLALVGEWEREFKGFFNGHIGDYEYYSFTVLKFNKTNKLEEYSDVSKYGVRQYGYPDTEFYEWEIVNGKFGKKLWGGSSIFEWEYQEYEIIENELHLYYTNYLGEQDAFVYTRRK